MTTYSDNRCHQIEKNFNAAVAQYADRNLAGWVLDLLSDNRPSKLRSRNLHLHNVPVCYAYASGNPSITALWSPA